MVASASPTAISRGQSATIELTITNNGPDPAPDVDLLDQISGDTGASNSDPAQGLISATIGTKDVLGTVFGGGPTSIGAIAPGQSVTLVLVYKPSNNEQVPIAISAEAYAFDSDPEPSGDFDSTAVGYLPPPAPNLMITQASSSPAFAVGVPIQFTVKVANIGNADAINVGILDAAAYGITGYSTSQGWPRSSPDSSPSNSARSRPEDRPRSTSRSRRPMAIRSRTKSP